MANPTSKISKIPEVGQNPKSDDLLPLAQRIDMLADDLARAQKYGMGLILFVVYQAEATRAAVEQQVRARLAELGQRVRRVQFFAGDHATDRSDLMERLRANPPAENEAVFIYDLHHAFPGLLNALNYKREFVPDHKWRLLFWVREDEIIRVMRDAPDFWAFVNQTIELPETPPPAEHARYAEQLTWAGLEWEDEFRRLTSDERRARIALRERLLADLPDDESTVAARAELHYVLGGLYAFEQEFEKAEQHLKKMLELAEETGDRRQMVNCLNGLGNVYRAMGQTEAAIAAYRRALELDSKFYTAHNNLAGVYLELERLDEAIPHLQKRVELSPDDALAARVMLGILARHQGRNDEARQQFETALGLWETAWQRRLQTPAGLLENKALALLGAGQPKEALSTLQEALARRVPGDKFDLKLYELLATAPEPPPGLDEMRELLEVALAEEGK